MPIAIAHADVTTYDAPSLIRPQAVATSHISLNQIVHKSKFKLSLNFTNDSYINAKSNYFGANQKSSDLETAGFSIDHTKSPFSLHAHAFYSAQENTPYVDVPELSYKIKRRSFNMWLGRHREVWSHADSFWRFGYWQPRFNWDGLRPTQDGLTGAFFQPKIGKALKLTAFATPFYFPETDPTFYKQNNMLVSQNPWFRDTPPIVQLWQTQTPVQMNIDMPKLSSVVLKPSVGFKFDYHETSAATLHLAYAYKPMNTPVLGYQYQVATDATGTYMAVDVEPRFDYHQITTVENTFHAGEVDIVPSLTYDDPQLSPVPVEWIAQDLSPSWIGSLTTNWNIDGDNSQNLYGGGMYVWGGQPGDRGENAQPGSQFAMRPLFLSALRIGYSITRDGFGGDIHSFSTEATYDPRLNGWQLLNQYAFTLDKVWQACVRADLLGMFSEPKLNQQQGFFALYRSNSMASLDVNYVF